MTVSGTLRCLGGIVFGLTAACACWESDGTIVEVSGAPSLGVGPIGDRLSVGERIDLEGLKGAVDVVRDQYGLVHIYASAYDDALRAEGFMMARDRSVQLEVLRRIAEGRMAEIVGDTRPSVIDQDIAMRTIGLHRVAKAEVAALDLQGDARRGLDAMAGGISEWFARIRDGRAKLATAFASAKPSWFTPWEPADSLAVLKLSLLATSYDIDAEIEFQQLLDRVRATFGSNASEDALRRRAGILGDLVRFAPAEPAVVQDGFSGGQPFLRPPTSSLPPGGGYYAPAVSADLLASVQGYVLAHRESIAPLGRTGLIGSNVWAVQPPRSASGHAMIGADLQAALSSPSPHWFVHLDVSASSGGHGSTERPLSVAGAAIPGVPGVVIGFNHTVGWASSPTRYDVSDGFAETLSSDGTSVTTLGYDVPLTHIKEPIAIAGQPSLEYEVLVVPHHGPILPRIESHTVVPPDPGVGAISVRWIGLEPTGEIEALTKLMRARTVAEARDAAQSTRTGGWGWMLADAQAHIAYDAPTQIPLRDRRAFLWDATKTQGQLPCQILSGRGTAEWVDSINGLELPRGIDPRSAILVDANADPVGVTLDNDPTNETLPDGTPVYLGCWFDIGFRQDRVGQLLDAASSPLTVDAMAEVHRDGRSVLGARLVPHLIAALVRAQTEATKAGTYPGLSKVVKTSRYANAPIAELLAQFDEWRTLEFEAGAGVRNADGTLSEATGEDARVSNTTLIFNTWLVRLMQLVFYDETSEIGLGQGLPGDLQIRSLLHLLRSDPSFLQSYDAEMRDSVLWDNLNTPQLESRDEQMIVAMLDAIDWLASALGDKRSDWRWGLLHTTRLEPLAPGVGFARVPPLDDPFFGRGYPRHGDLFALDNAPYEMRPSTFDDLSFSFRHGSVFRMVIDLGASGPEARMSMAGEESVESLAPGGSSEVEYWRENTNHPVAFSIDAAIAWARTNGGRMVLNPVSR